MTTLLRLQTWLCISSLALLGAGCGDDDDDGDTHADGGHRGEDSGAPDAGEADEGIEIAGEWAGMFGDETITDRTWDNGFSVATIVRYDNDQNEAITQDPPSEDDAGVETEGAFSKIVWTEIEADALYYCTVSFLQPSAADAEENAMPADDGDPEMGGCGDSDFPWTKLERK